LLNCSVIFVWSGTSGSVGVAHDSISSACGTEPGGACETKRCGAHDAQGVGSRGVGCSSVGQSVNRVQVMDLWSITLGEITRTSQLVNQPSQPHVRLNPMHAHVGRSSQTLVCFHACPNRADTPLSSQRPRTCLDRRDSVIFHYHSVILL
jgi:hypothetical protein